jgi:hypothetical protein
LNYNQSTVIEKHNDSEFEVAPIEASFKYGRIARNRSLKTNHRTWKKTIKTNVFKKTIKTGFWWMIQNPTE